LSLELCAVIYHISPMALSRLICAFGHQSLVTWLTDKSEACPPTLLSSVYTLFGTTVYQGG
jgi:hypothetical protein